MDKECEDWIHHFESELAMSSKAFRDAVTTVVSRIHQYSPGLLKKRTLTNDAAFSSAAKPLSLQTETAVELEVTERILRGLFDYHCELRPSLAAPRSFSPLAASMPLINANSIPIGIVEYLVSSLYGQRESTDELGRTLLIIAHRTGLSRVAELDELLSISLSEYLVLTDQQLVSVYLPKLHRRVYLFCESILAIHWVLSQDEWKSRNSKTRIKKIRQAISGWLTDAGNRCTNRHLSHAIKNMSVSEALKNIGLLDSAIGLQHAWPDNYALDDVSLVSAFTGRCIGHGDKLAGGSSRLWNDESFAFGECEDMTPEQRYRQRSEESEAHRQLRQVLSDFKKADPQEHRNTQAYRHTKESLIKLSEQSLPWQSALVIRWITALFVHGSPWKERLAIGSLLTYHSTLNTFIQVAWRDVELTDISQEEFEEACQAGLDHFEQAGTQYTVARFLRYCQQYATFPNIDLDIFTTIASDGVVRAHYIAPAIFDRECRKFCAGKGYYEKKIVLLMQLCYYAGLREDEALSLRCRDIDFDTGMIYITSEKKRKTPHAVRKIPLALLPELVLRHLAQEIDEQLLRSEREPRESALLFTDWAYAELENQFIESLRNATQLFTIVTHSLRHCAAMNWTILLAFIAFDLRLTTPYYMLDHEIFSEAHRQRIVKLFAISGRSLKPYFPVLEWVSQKMGHSGPATTFAVYLHLMDWLSLVITNQSPLIAKSLVRQWVSSNSYGFTRQRLLFDEENDYSLMGKLQPQCVMEFATRAFKSARHVQTLQVSSEIDKASSQVLSFSHFIDEISKQYQGASDNEKYPQFIHWLKSNDSLPPQLVIHPGQEFAWLRLCQAVDGWIHRKDAHLMQLYKAFPCLLRLIEHDIEITRYRDLVRVITAYKALNLGALTMKIQGKVDSKMVKHWLDYMDKNHVKSYLIDSESKTSANVRPYQMRWALWQNIKEIIQLLILYLDYVSKSRAIPRMEPWQLIPTQEQ